MLAFDTATPAVTVALHDGTAAVASSTVVDARRHGELLAPGIQTVLREAGADAGLLTHVVVGVGPGPYTGLRVGVVTARTFAAVLGIPVHGVCTLDVLAHECLLTEPFVVATDARRKEVYWARYGADGSRLTEPAVNKPGDVADEVAGDEAVGDEVGPGCRLPAVGQGALLYPEAFPDERPPTYPSAVTLAALAAERLSTGEALPPPEPLYLRRPHAQSPGPPKQVSQLPGEGRREKSAQ